MTTTIEILIFLVLPSFIACQNETFCGKPYVPDLCSNGDHVACITYFKGIAICPGDFAPVTFEESLKSFILHKHNSYRNEIAMGTWSPFKKAYAMPTVEWDENLAYIAQANANTCKFKHDLCRKTLEFRWSGQNTGWSKGFKNITEAIEAQIEKWWDERKNATYDDILKFKSSTNTVGHFTVMVQDRCNRLGCGAVTYNKDELSFTCNYSFTNIRRSFVYREGARAAEGCKSGINPQYPNLCNSKERVDATPYAKQGNI